MVNIEEYKSMLSELIKKQVVMLGPSVALGKAKKVEGLQIDDQGNVTNITGDPKQVLKDLANEYMEISSQIAQNTIEALLNKYPGIESPN
jgi:chemotaxis protein CheY-P-specific phosphatase CheC